MNIKEIEEIEKTESMKMIRRIREKHYEETKDMSSEERIAYIRKKSDELMKRYGLKLKVPVKTNK